MIAAATPWVAAAFLLLLAGAPRAAKAAAADSLALDGRIVRHVEIDTRSIFDPLPEHGRALYGFVNRIHVLTRARTVRSAFVFHEGRPWSEAQRQETERHLRAMEFVLPDTVQVIPVGDDSVDVHVVTHDNWTTSPEFSAEGGGGQRFGSVALSERNFLGMGTSLSLSYRSDVTGISRVARIDDGELFGTHWQGGLSYGSKKGGSSRSALLMLPFWADDAPTSVTGFWARDAHTEDLFVNDDVVATVPVVERSSDFAFGRGHRTGAGTIVRWVGAFEQRDRDLGAVEVLPGAPAAFAGPPERLRIRQLTGELRLVRPRYLVVRGVDHMDRDEDVDLGPSLAMMGGVAPRAFGSTNDEAVTRLQVGLGRNAGRFGYGWVRGRTQARLRPGIHDPYSEVNAMWVQQPKRDVAAVFAASGVAGSSDQRNFQVTLGGITGLRGFPVHELTGTRYWRGNAELRWVGVRDLLKLVSFGGAAFWDAGRTYGTGATDQSWRQDVGIGLRLSLPHSSVNAVARFDVAWPITPMGAEHHGPVYSFGSGQAF